MKPNPCLDKKCENSCSTITEAQRLVIFNKYWKELDSCRKRDYLSSCMEMQDVKRNYGPRSNKRLCSYNYFVAVDDNIQKKICRQFLLNNFHIAEK